MTRLRVGLASGVLVAVAVVTATAMLAMAKDVPSYPEGLSSQTVDGHVFDLVVPKAADAKPPYSLLVVVAGAGTLAEQFAPLSKEGWVVVLPKQRFSGGMWATSETKDIEDDVETVATAYSVAAEHVHFLAIDDSRGFGTFVAYGKRRSFASVSFNESNWMWVGNAKSPPADARKHLRVLLMGERPDTSPTADPAAIAAALADKVRSAEYRHDADPFKPYFRYWLSATDGRFKPGYDLSFEWIADTEPPAAKPGEKALPSMAKPGALDSGRASARAKGAAAFVYFWSADDAPKPEAKALQNEVFFDAEVRAAAKGLVAVKLERAKYEAAFTGFGLKTTPAVAVVDHDFAVLERFEGVVDAKAFAKSLARAAAGAAKPK